MTNNLEARMTERALAIGNDAESLLEWLATRDICLSEISVQSATTGRHINALAALVANAPTWLRETVLDAPMFSDQSLMDMQVGIVAGRTLAADQACVEFAPEWLRAALVDWLYQNPIFARECEALVEESRK